MQRFARKLEIAIAVCTVAVLLWDSGASVFAERCTLTSDCGQDPVWLHRVCQATCEDGVVRTVPTDSSYNSPGDPFLVSNQWWIWRAREPYLYDLGVPLVLLGMVGFGMAAFVRWNWPPDDPPLPFVT